MDAEQPIVSSETSTQTQESAPENKKENENTVSQVEANPGETSEVKVGQNDVPKSLKKDLYDLRQQRREFKARIAQMEQEIAGLKSSKAPQTEPSHNQGASGTAPTIFDNPDAYLAMREKQFEERISQKILDRKSVV